jgi:hypothetical protein
MFQFFKKNNQLFIYRDTRGIIKSNTEIINAQAKIKHIQCIIILILLRLYVVFRKYIVAGNIKSHANAIDIFKSGFIVLNLGV